ncbi:hypothetical protein [Kosmotoga pacifica]|nr:hypothetical protein [Kosmotoga pacifica]
MKYVVISFIKSLEPRDRKYEKVAMLSFAQAMCSYGRAYAFGGKKQG